MKYGPGKFEGCGNYSLVSQHIYAFPDDELGDVNDFGWYGLFSGKIKGRGPFHSIVSEDSQGFVDVSWYESEDILANAWETLNYDYLEFCGPREETK